MVVFNFKRVFIVLAISILWLSAKAQQQQFVYVQTESGQPFYVKLNSKLISSSPAGYIILPGMNDGDYHLVIGFPKNEFPEESFDLSVDKKNEGYLLKNLGEKGWALLNIQSMALLQGNSSKPVVTETVAPKVQNDAFSNMLASVVKDSSILQKNEPVVETPPVAKVPETSSDVVVAVTPEIKRLLSEKDKDGTQMIYLDKKDTVRVFIPSAKSVSTMTEHTAGNKMSTETITSNAPANVDTAHLTITPTVVTPEPDTVTLVNDTIRIYKEPAKELTVQAKEDPITPKKTDVKPLITIIEPTPSVVIEEKPSTIKKSNEIVLLPKAVTSSSVNSDCKAFANDVDFLKLRKKMAAETSDDDMVQAAKKVFRTKCFSTEQIKNLSYLFLTNEGKYMFFDAAYPFTSDSDQYASLVSQLTDDYYIKRFNAMIHK